MGLTKSLMSMSNLMKQHRGNQNMNINQVQLDSRICEVACTFIQVHSILKVIKLSCQTEANEDVQLISLAAKRALLICDELKPVMSHLHDNEHSLHPLEDVFNVHQLLSSLDVQVSELLESGQDCRKDESDLFRTINNAMFGVARLLDGAVKEFDTIFTQPANKAA